MLVAFSLYEWSSSLGLVNLPESTETLLAASTLISPYRNLPFDPKQISLRGTASDPNFSVHLQKLHGIIGNSTLSLAKCIEEVAVLLSSPQRTEMRLLNEKNRRQHFNYWSLISQLLLQPASQLQSDEAWLRLAGSMVDIEGGDAVLDWISCLRNPEKISALTLAGLGSK